MSAASLPTEAWVVIGLIIGLGVLQCLLVLANMLEYELGLQKLVREVHALREAVFGPPASVEPMTVTPVDKESAARKGTAEGSAAAPEPPAEKEAA